MSDLQEPGFAASDIIVGLGSAFGSLSETEKKARIKRTNGVFELRVSKDGKEAVWTVDQRGHCQEGTSRRKARRRYYLVGNLHSAGNGKAQRSKSIHDRKSEGELSVSLELLGLLTHPLQTKGLSPFARSSSLSPRLSSKFLGELHSLATYLVAPMAHFILYPFQSQSSPNPDLGLLGDMIISRGDKGIKHSQVILFRTTSTRFLSHRIKRSILSARLNADMLSYVIGTASSFIRPWGYSSAPQHELVRVHEPEKIDTTNIEPRVTDQSGSQPESSIEHILHHSDLYVILDTSRSANHEDLRRAYMNMCRRCHPDKFPNEPLATVAFQKLSYAYSVLSDNRKRRLYDTNGTAEPGGAQDMHGANDMLNRVLLAIWADFLDGDFELIKMLLPAGQQHFRLLKFEMMRLYEIQHALRQLSYFDVPGRLKLTIQLARLTLALPVNVDKAIMAEQREENSQQEVGVGRPRGRYLPSSIHSVIGLACVVLEKGESVLPTRV
ncbi:DnaJ domain-containing protein [Rhizoctonia solani AG-1 IA]|uniref:DnaJ domain-containing protein n=1 Tax=Thanatephorus cucumeris (strain AG1-IA) TaxID=983506 RepID=L8WTT1_THACA|nr:DnaJ domain-containing protein [Rhizoctonia solani AG-1 IA]